VLDGRCVDGSRQRRDHAVLESAEVRAVDDVVGLQHDPGGAGAVKGLGQGKRVSGIGYAGLRAKLDKRLEPGCAAPHDTDGFALLKQFAGDLRAGTAGGASDDIHKG
jgi:hypothetical protein